MLEADEVAGSHLIVMEVVWGVDLHRVIQRLLQTGWGRMPLASVLLVGRGICRALLRAGAPHGDLDPYKILVGRDGEVRVGGFGLHPLRRLAEAWSTPRRYRAPELAESAGHPYRDAAPRLEHQADVYSLGRILLELATRRLVFPSGPTLTNVANVANAANVDPELAGRMQRFFERALAQHPLDRFPDPRQTLDAWLEVAGATELSGEGLGAWVRDAFPDQLI
jgi:serine/threonine protein kinase